MSESEKILLKAFVEYGPLNLTSFTIWPLSSVKSDSFWLMLMTFTIKCYQSQRP